MLFLGLLQKSESLGEHELSLAGVGMYVHNAPPAFGGSKRWISSP